MTSPARAMATLAAALLVLFAGCLGPQAAPAPEPSETPGTSNSPDPFSTPTPTTTTGGNGTGSGNSTGGGSGNGTGGNGTGSGNGTGGNGTGGNNTGNNNTGNDTGPAPVWPDIAQAKVRPGVQVVVAGALCTSNFLFRSTNNDTLYLGLAAHCVDGSPIGTEAIVRDTAGSRALTGRVAYSSWYSIGFVPGSTSVGDDAHPHDFALIEIPKDQQGIVHPAVLVYGGPTAMADFDSVGIGDRVIVYGNSNLYPRPGDLDPQEGIVLDTHEETVDSNTGHMIDTHMQAAPVPGDSGSGLMTKDGKALGALSVITAGLPYGAWWQYSSVPHAIEHLNSNGWSLELQTWEQLDSGLLP